MSWTSSSIRITLWSQRRNLLLMVKHTQNWSTIILRSRSRWIISNCKGGVSVTQAFYSKKRRILLKCLATDICLVVSIFRSFTSISRGKWISMWIRIVTRRKTSRLIRLTLIMLSLKSLVSRISLGVHLKNGRESCIHTEQILRHSFNSDIKDLTNTSM